VAIAPIRNGQIEITFFAFVDAEKRVILQGLNVSPTGSISGRFSVDTGLLADEVDLHPSGDRLVLIARQGNSVSLSLWAFNFSAAQMGPSLLRSDLASIGSFTGSNLDMNYAAPISGSAFRIESLARTGGGDWAPLGGAIQNASGRLLSTDAFGTTPGDGDFRRVAVLTVSEGPTGIWPGWLLWVNRLLTEAGTLSLSVYGADVDGGVQSASLQQETRVDLEGWFGIAYDGAVLTRTAQREFVTAHTGHTTWRRFFRSDRGRPVLRLIYWGLTESGSADFGEVGINRLDSVDIEGTFTAPRITSPLGDAMVLTLLNDRGQLVFRPFTVSQA